MAVVPLGGAHAIGPFLARLAAGSPGARLAGLCDAREEPVFRRALEAYGPGSAAGLDVLGFDVCVEDLEDELIRALGPAGVEAVLAAQRDLGPFRTFQKQPAWRGRPVEAQLRRFFGSADSRKTRYARLLVEALDAAQVPRPLDALLARV